MRFSVVLVAGMAMGNGTGAATTTTTIATTTASTFTETWDELLKGYVGGGKVDYQKLASKQEQLNAVTAGVANAKGAQKLAFYLDAYNVTVVAAVLAHGQPASVLDVKGFFDAEKHAIAGNSWTLNQLETHIRKTFKDARVHFALNCAAQSCPALYGRAFSSTALDETLSRLTAHFLNGAGVTVDDAKKTLLISKLFEWYREDFGPIDAYLRKWLAEPKRKAALDAGYTVAIADYDWKLNRK